ncbi:hypothetical protein GALL_449430 [mine drainage metagenome]|uniref:Uncharacterized protein n=1 Tax=mine drainage metagenome TaxID=410659 RepID=A0A1J5Q0P1_9ZZZZ
MRATASSALALLAGKPGGNSWAKKCPGLKGHYHDGSANPFRCESTKSPILMGLRLPARFEFRGAQDELAELSAGLPSLTPNPAKRIVIVG